MMSAVTAVSGSGPGFFFGLIEDKPESEWAVYATNIFTPLLIEAAREAGFTRQQAQTLAVATAEGSLALLRQAGVSPQALRQQVTSKGGTTEAGLEALSRTQSLVQAVRAAMQMAEELAQGS
jgi:pyrroline-5-carboxylate reductase